MNMDTEWATLDEIIADAETPRALVVDWEKDGKPVKIKFYFCELTGEDTSIADMARLIDETGKPKDPIAIAQYMDALILKRLMKANGKTDGWEMSEEKWRRLPEGLRARVLNRISAVDKERTESFLSGQGTAPSA
jgi:hypothetical protein